jgi:integrase
MCKEKFQEQNRKQWEEARGLTGQLPESEKWTEEETNWVYGKSLEWSAEIAGKAKSDGGDESRRKIWAEYRKFLSKNAYGVTVETARAEDVLAFIRGFWIPRHVDSCRTVAGATGSKVVALSTVKHALQDVSKCYDILGREGRDNPAKGESVRAFKEGYRRMLHDLGVREKKAVVFKEGKIEDVVAFLVKEIGKMSPGLERCCEIMDLAAILYLWEAWVRGKECGSLEKRQVREDEGVALPGWSKTVQAEPSGRIELEQKKGSMTFLKAAAALVKETEAIGQPVGEGFLFRPLTRDRKSFRQEAIAAGALRLRIQKVLKRAGVYEGETLHSFRRSAAQHAVEVRGCTVEETMRRGRWKTFSAFQGYVEEVASSANRNCLPSAFPTDVESGNAHKDWIYGSGWYA